MQQLRRIGLQSTNGRAFEFFSCPKFDPIIYIISPTQDQRHLTLGASRIRWRRVLYRPQVEILYLDRLCAYGPRRKFLPIERLKWLLGCISLTSFLLKEQTFLFFFISLNWLLFCLQFFKVTFREWIAYIYIYRYEEI